MRAAAMAEPRVRAGNGMGGFGGVGRERERFGGVLKEGGGVRGAARVWGWRVELGG